MFEQLQNVGPKLVPFLKTLVIYFVIFMPHDKPSFIAAIIKCLPIISLIIFVIWYSKDFGQKNIALSKKIGYGLLFSCIGDFCLIWPQTFDLGMLSFAIGHINYIRAFGFQPLCLPIGIGVYVVSFIGVLWLLPGLHGVLVPGVPIYAIVIGTMLWRALARLNNNWTVTKVFTALGAISFVLSDLIIGIDKFKYRVPHDQVLIMGTYYAAQFGISLSILDFNTKTEQKTN